MFLNIIIIKKIWTQNQINFSLKAIIITNATGIQAIVLQYAGVISTNQNVKVVNSVDLGCSVGEFDEVDANLDNTVDVNISKINGHINAFYDHGYNGV